MKGDIIGKSKRTTLTRTLTLYLKRIKIFMVLYEEEVVANDPYSLLDRKLHIYQFFDYKHPHFLELPRTLHTSLRSPNIKQLMFSGFCQLVDYLF